jgi:hypothetical protein
MLSKIHPFYFFLSFAVGLLVCYVTNPKPEVIVKFPSPYNAGQVTYKGDDNTCYKYKADKVQCPLDKSMIKPQPVMS